MGVLGQLFDVGKRIARLIPRAESFRADVHRVRAAVNGRQPGFKIARRGEQFDGF
jgi:hypothetical protein